MLDRTSNKGDLTLYGKELRVSQRLLEGGANLTVFRPRTIFEIDELANRLLHRIYLRPASEPILLSWRGVLSSTNWTVPIAVDFVSALRGLRTFPSCSQMHSSGGDGISAVSYDPHGYDIWEDRIGKIRSLDLTPWARALVIYATTIILHPLVDGNGLLARSLFNISMCESHLEYAPILPMSPVFYVTNRYHIEKLHNLCESSSWEKYLTDMFPVVSAAVSFSNFDHLQNRCDARVL